MEYFLQRFNQENNKRVRISDKAMGLILEYPWPGNVRQLENCIERLVIMTDEEIVEVDELPYEIRVFDRVIDN